ncbi:Tissue alpha-L-fucosidase [Larimichthys crocea]|uniref:Uncharacterized protein n=1 Tax=Larimichthys crocea TaxID=215358 RepID=A0ACD3RFY8_LARCR|nr:Tissue alpha-L-fucosidase [Larimichthys crocea]
MRLTCITPLSCLISLLVWGCAGCTPRYSPDWTSLDKRPLPEWYDEAKLGIFIQWGVYSVPASGKNAEWIWERQGKNSNYQDYVSNFTAESFDPKSWAELFQASGARYVVFTAKHHDGFTNWPSAQSRNWSSVDVGPHRDLVGDMASAVRNRSMHFGVGYSQFEWFNPDYLSDKDSGFKSQKFVDEKVIPQLRDLVIRYKPELIWGNGYWEAPDTYWKSKDFLAWLYNSSPVKDEVVTNDGWGKDTSCKHGDFYTCRVNYMPDKLVNHKWERCQSIDKNSWGYRKDMQASEVMDLSSIINERLKGLGGWLKANGEAIYGSRPWKVQKEDCKGNCKGKCTVWYTSKDDAVYAIIVGSTCTRLELTEPKRTKDTKVTLVGKCIEIKPDDKSTDLIIPLPDNSNAWCLKLEGVE